MISEYFLQSAFGLDNLVDLAIVIFSLILCTLSIKAYKDTGLKKIAFASAAFALFSVQLFFEYAEDGFDYLDNDATDMIGSLMTLGILILFFIAIIKRR